MSMENPFLSPAPGEPALVPVPPPWEPPPRVWTAIVVPIVGIVVALAATIAVSLVAAITDLGAKANLASVAKWLQESVTTPVGLVLSVVPMQFVLLAVACVAAVASKERFAKRLALKRGRMPIWSWPFLALATPLFGLLSSIMLSALFTEPSENMKLVEKIFRSLSDSFFPGLVLLVGIVPGIVEEFMFRGYLQSRLLKRWHPAAAIGLSAILFSVAHLDWMHVLGVLPLGVWLGVIAWRSGSIWPAILGHAANNTIAVVAVKFEGAASLAILLFGGPSLVLAIVLMCLRFSGSGEPASHGGGSGPPLAAMYPPPQWQPGLPQPQMPWLQQEYSAPPQFPPTSPPPDFGTPGREVG